MIVIAGNEIIIECESITAWLGSLGQNKSNKSKAYRMETNTTATLDVGWYFKISEFWNSVWKRMFN